MIRIQSDVPDETRFEKNDLLVRVGFSCLPNWQRPAVRRTQPRMADSFAARGDIRISDACIIPFGPRMDKRLPTCR